MKREQIEQWARASNFYDDQIAEMGGMLERFAALVAAHEREQCALVCEAMFSDGALNVAAAIRART